MNNILINQGGSIKSLEEKGDLVTVGDYGILWGSVDNADLAGDFFTPDTYFGARKGVGVDCMLHHGLPLRPELKAYTTMLLPATVKAEPDEHGLLVATVLDRRDAYQRKIYELTDAGALSWSSGAITRAVKRAGGAKFGEIKQWPIFEFSFTPSPAEQRLGFNGIRELDIDAESVKSVEEKFFDLPSYTKAVSVLRDFAKSDEIDTQDVPDEIKTDDVNEELRAAQSRFEQGAVEGEAQVEAEQKAGTFEESKHPRDGGKFTSKGGASQSSDPNKLAGQDKGDDKHVVSTDERVDNAAKKHDIPEDGARFLKHMAEKDEHVANRIEEIARVAKAAQVADNKKEMSWDHIREAIQMAGKEGGFRAHVRAWNTHENNDHSLSETLGMEKKPMREAVRARAILDAMHSGAVKSDEGGGDMSDDVDASEHVENIKQELLDTDDGPDTHPAIFSAMSAGLTSIMRLGGVVKIPQPTWDVDKTPIHKAIKEFAKYLKRVHHNNNDDAPAVVHAVAQTRAALKGEQKSEDSLDWAQLSEEQKAAFWSELSDEQKAGMWEEHKHPRGPGGKFAPKGGGSGAPSSDPNKVPGQGKPKDDADKGKSDDDGDKGKPKDEGAREGDGKKPEPSDEDKNRASDESKRNRQVAGAQGHVNNAMKIALELMAGRVPAGERKAKIGQLAASIFRAKRANDSAMRSLNAKGHRDKMTPKERKKYERHQKLSNLLGQLSEATHPDNAPEHVDASKIHELLKGASSIFDAYHGTGSSKSEDELDNGGELFEDNEALKAVFRFDGLQVGAAAIRELCDRLMYSVVYTVLSPSSYPMSPYEQDLVKIIPPSLEERQEFLEDALDEFSEIVQNIVGLILQMQGDEMPEDAAKSLKDLQSLGERLPLAEHSDKVLAVASEFKARTDDLLAIRAKERKPGRLVSDAVAQRLDTTCSSLKGLVQSFEEMLGTHGIKTSPLPQSVSHTHDASTPDNTTQSASAANNNTGNESPDEVKARMERELLDAEIRFREMGFHEQAMAVID